MHLSKLILLNWGQVEPNEYDLGPLVQLSGVTGSGKSTTADAIQTLMTAAKDGLYSYNPGQDESSQRSKIKIPRSLASYIVGAEATSYARPEGAHGYIAGVFVPSPGEDLEPFTALIGCAARVDVERQGEVTKRLPVIETLQLITIEGAELSLDDLIANRLAGSVQAISVYDVYSHLRKKFSGIQSFADNKKLYLEKLYGLLKGGRATTAEAEQAAKTLSRFMAYKPLDSINDFVRDQVLEPHDIHDRVANVGKLMRDVADLKKEAERYRTNITALTLCKQDGQRVLKGAMDELQGELKLALFQEKAALDGLTSNKRKIEALNAEKDRLDLALQELKSRDASLYSEESTVKTARLQHSAASLQDNLNQSLQMAQESYRQALRSMNAAVTRLSANLNGIRQIAGFDMVAFDAVGLPQTEKIVNEAAALVARIEADNIGSLLLDLLADQGFNHAHCASLLELVAGIEQTMRNVTQLLRGDESSLLSLSIEAASKVESELKAVETLLNERIAEQKSLKAGVVLYPEDVRLALDRIQEAMPDAHARVLCEHIRPLNEEWQPAIEALIGSTRFAILVDPAFEAPAKRLVNSNRDTSRVLIAQVALASKDAHNATLPHRSIVHELQIDDPQAKSFIVAKYGVVEKVASVEDLTSVRRGLTLDGQTAGGYVMARVKDDLERIRLVFGQAARAASANALDTEIDDLKQQKERLENDLRSYKLVKNLAAEFTHVEIESHAVSMMNATRNGVSIMEQISQLDVSEIADLDTQLKRILDDRKQISKDIEAKLYESGGISNQIKTAIAEVERLEASLDGTKINVTTKAAALQIIGSLIVDFDYPAIEAALRASIDSPDTTEASIGREISNSQSGFYTHRSQLRDHLKAYHDGNVRASERLEISFSDIFDNTDRRDRVAALVELMRSLDHQIKTQTNVGLAEKVERLTIAEQDFNTAFTSDFCQILHESLRKGRKTLEALNVELKEFRFGDETYEFSSSWVPGFKRYADFFQQVMSMDDIGETSDLFANTGLTPEMAAVRNELRDYLLSNDSEAARKKLEELSDYRNYHRYEIWKVVPGLEKVALSTYGTASGGQFETPAYVIRLAAVSSAFKLRENHKGHLRMLVTDEAFGKMDEQRARAVLRYMTDVMKMQVIYIVPNTRSGVFLDIATHQMLYSRVESASAPGELKHLILVHWQELKNEPLKKLWSSRRAEVERNAILEFNEMHPL